MKKYFYFLDCGDKTESKQINEEKAKEIFKSKYFKKFRDTKKVEYKNETTTIYDFKHISEKVTLLLFVTESK